ncbi:MAG: porin [Pseudomonadota bacterium]
MAQQRKLQNVVAGALLGASATAFCGVSAFAADPIEIDVSGHASVVAGVSDGDGAADADAEIRVKGSTVFANGVEIGAVVEGRLDGQQPRQMFAGGRYSSFLIGGPRGVGPFRSDLYLQGAFAYARGGFGEVIVGRDHGVARTLAVTAPTIFNSMNVNDWRTDLSGLNDVHTVNDFSGYATKVTYMPPANIFGGPLGSLRFGMSYSPNLMNCGEGICAPADALLLTPETLLLNESSNWSDVVETAAYYQKEVKLGGPDRLLLGFGASYVTADENALVAEPVFGDYEAISLGLNLGYRGVTIGGSVKTTNAGFIEGDDNYLAFDAGVTYQTGEEKGDWGFMLGYGRSEADVVGPNLVNPNLFQDTQTAQAGVTYFLGRGIAIGAAAQFVESTKPVESGGQDEAATVVIESSIKF